MLKQLNSSANKPRDVGLNNLDHLCSDDQKGYTTKLTVFSAKLTICSEKITVFTAKYIFLQSGLYFQ